MRIDDADKAQEHYAGNGICPNCGVEIDSWGQAELDGECGDQTASCTNCGAEIKFELLITCTAVEWTKP